MPQQSKPKVLLFDIETMAHTAFVWEKWQTNVIAFKEYGQIISIAWMWLGGPVHSLTLRDTKSKSDLELCKVLYALFQEADILIGHNLDSFDVKKAKTRFLFHDFEPVKRLSTIDTKKVAKSAFGFVSNSLNDLAHYLGLGSKLKHEGFELWLKCMEGDREAWKKMACYNEQDVRLLHRVYKRMKPWVLQHPSLAKLQNKEGCPNCGSEHVIKQGVRGSHTGLRQQMQCTECSAWYLVTYKK